MFTNKFSIPNHGAKHPQAKALVRYVRGCKPQKIVSWRYILGSKLGRGSFLVPEWYILNSSVTPRFFRLTL